MGECCASLKNNNLENRKCIYEIKIGRLLFKDARENKMLCSRGNRFLTVQQFTFILLYTDKQIKKKYNVDSQQYHQQQKHLKVLFYTTSLYYSEKDP